MTDPTYADRLRETLALKLKLRNAFTLDRPDRGRRTADPPGAGCTTRRRGGAHTCVLSEPLAGRPPPRQGPRAALGTERGPTGGNADATSRPDSACPRRHRTVVGRAGSVPRAAGHRLPRSVQCRHRIRTAAGAACLGRHDGGGDRSRWQERLGVRALRRASCAESKLPPILHFDPSGKLLASFGAGMFVFPHGIAVDPEGNVWVADADGRNGKGHVVVKFSPTGKVLLTLGKPGMPGDAPGFFNRPTGIAIARNGDIFVADGHGGDSNARVVKFSKAGRFVTAWGRKGTEPGEFDTPHAIAVDSQSGLRRRPFEQPHPGVRREWHIHRRLEAVRPSERGLCRRARRDLRRQLADHRQDGLYHPTRAAATASAPAALRTAWCSRSFRGRTAIRSVRRVWQWTRRAPCTALPTRASASTGSAGSDPGVPVGRPAIG